MFRSFVLADLITLANASCGMGAIFLCLSQASGSHGSYFWIIFVLFPLALICDILDGLVARLASHSPLEADIDSLADVVSFGVAPAVLGFTLGLRGCCTEGQKTKNNITEEVFVGEKELWK